MSHDSSQHRSTVLYDSPLVRLVDWRCGCAHADASWGDEEVAEQASICFVRRGAFQRRVDGGEALVDTNRVAFFEPGAPYRVHHPLGGGDVCTDLQLGPDLLRELEPERPFGRAEGACSDRLYVRHRVLLADAADGADALSLEETAVRLVDELLDEAAPDAVPAQRPTTARAHRETTEAARHFLGQRFRQRIGLSDVSAAVHHSPFGLSRLFKRAMGTSLHRYLVRLRLRAALEPLAEGQADLTALALELGFGSHSHFTTAFRRELGVAPSALRRRLTTGDVTEMGKILEA